MQMLRKLIISLMVLLFFVGLGIAVYPIVNGQITDFQIRLEATDFLSSQKPPLLLLPDDTSSTPDTETIPNPTETQIPYQELLSAIELYNQELWNNCQSGLNDPSDYVQPDFILRNYGIESEVFGVISIPKLDLNMPLFLGATQQNLADGAAILSQTSIPIGGTNTNTVVAGHRGFNGAAYFRHITDLVPGDEVIITNLWEELHYEVVETKIIAPYEVDQILIQPGRELVTLLTCHPYASGGKQRFLVFCERVP